ncbi:hypothetical protein COOONC_03889 [Cooperia oncophora]
MPKSSGDANPAPATLEVLLQSMIQQLQFQHEEMKFVADEEAGLRTVAKTYDQLNKEVQKFVADEEAGQTFDYWYKRYGPMIRESSFVAGLQDPSLQEVRLRMLRRLDTQAEDTPLTIEDLVADCENFTALKMDNANMGTSHDIHAVQKKKVKCFGCGGPHFKSACPLLKQISKKPKRQHHRRKRKQCRNTALRERRFKEMAIAVSKYNLLGIEWCNFPHERNCKAKTSAKW